MTMREIQIPFPGFYGSEFDGMGDSYLEMEAYNRVEDGSNEGDESFYPEPLRLDGSDICDALHGAMNWRAAHMQMAQDYAAEFMEAAAAHLGVALPYEFGAVDSPREYNFETDRLFVKIDSATLESLFEKVKREGMEQFRATLKARHTSCSGFISFYSNDAAEWLEKPVDEWDHNELASLFIAALEMEGAGAGAAQDLEREAADSVIDYWQGNGGFDGHVDWPAYDSDIADKRAGVFECLFDRSPAAALQAFRDLVQSYQDGARAIMPALFKRDPAAAAECAKILGGLAHG